MNRVKTLITGGAGFIGANYVAFALDSSDDEIFVLDKLTYAGNLENLASVSDKITFIQGDICDVELVQNLFDTHRFQKVVHFAAESHVDNSISASLQLFLRHICTVQSNVLYLF